jgi:hypothetical protein
VRRALIGRCFSARYVSQNDSICCEKLQRDVQETGFAFAAIEIVRELQLTVACGYLNSRSALKNADAYDLILRGRHAADRWDKDGFDEAVTLFKQALDRDATSAALAFTYEEQGEDGFLAPAAAFEQARHAVSQMRRCIGSNAPMLKRTPVWSFGLS